MRFAQLVVYEGDGRLFGLLREAAAAREWRWALRRPRLPSTCLRLLARGAPSVLVLKLGRDLKSRELPLLEKVTWLYPDTTTVVLSDVDNPALTALAWDLGASLVLAPPPARDQLPSIIEALMESVTGTSAAGGRGA
jgi:hypothetical protein